MSIHQVSLSMDGGFVYKMNDQYYKITTVPNKNEILNLIQSDSIHMYIKKYPAPRKWFGKIFNETPEFYANVTKPTIKDFDLNSPSCSNTLHNDQDFILISDVKHTK